MSARRHRHRHTDRHARESGQDGAQQEQVHPREESEGPHTVTKFALAMHAARQVPLTRLGHGQGAHGPSEQGLACRNGVKTVKLVEAAMTKHES